VFNYDLMSVNVSSCFVIYSSTAFMYLCVVSSLLVLWSLWAYSVSMFFIT